jgi:predicted DNA repair protein MutK
MASGIFAILDDIAVLLDDAAVLSKVAAKKTAGLLGDDLAVNAEKATGFKASRELPVLWAITKGSFRNKLIILPLAFLLSAYAPWLIVPVLLLGGTYLSYEGAEKIYELFEPHEKHAAMATQVSAHPEEILKREVSKIKSAVRTDFILSIEIIVVGLGTVMEHSLLMQILVVSFIAILATIGVYGLVALLVRMDDVGFYLIGRSKGREGFMARVVNGAGMLLVAALPWIIRLLGFVGTAAMLLVGGGMFVHNIDVVHHTLDFMPTIAAELVSGLIVGAVSLLVVKLLETLLKKQKHKGLAQK